MKTSLRIASLSLCALMLGGCATNPSQGELLGGIAGGIVGSRFGGGTGRLVATGVGALVGAGIGRNLENQSQPQAQHVNAQPTGTDPCVQYQVEKGQAYGTAVSYCQGRRQRQLEAQQKMQQDAYRRGYNGF